MPVYARERVRYLWLIDPMVRTLEVFRLLGDDKYEATWVWRDNVTVRAEPFEAIELELSALWV